MMEPSDEDLEVYLKYASELTRFATGLVGPGDAPDVVQDAVLRAMYSRAWPSVHNKRAFLFRSVFNEAISSARSADRRRRREKKAADASVPAAEEELAPEVRAMVDRLSVRQRAVILLTYWADLDPSAIARLLRISEGSVHRHLARARARLKEMLEENAI